jgi:hypothetical protein
MSARAQYRSKLTVRSGYGAVPLILAAMSTKISTIEPQPELGPCMRSLPPRWQRAVTSLFISGGNRTEALRLAGYNHKSRNSLSVAACRLFQDARVRKAVREVAAEIIDTAEPELIETTFAILRDTTTDPKNRLAAARLLWDRSRPVMTQHRVEVDVTLSSDPLDELPVTIVDLEMNHCRWPISGEGVGMLYCAAPRVDGRPYCQEHCSIAYLPRKAPADRPQRTKPDIEHLLRMKNKYLAKSITYVVY